MLIRIAPKSEVLVYDIEEMNKNKSTTLESAGIVRDKTEYWESFITVALTTFFNKDKIKGKNSEMSGIYSSLITNNVVKTGNEILSYTKKKVRNPITVDDIERCIQQFVRGRNMDGGASTTFTNLVYKLNSNFDSSKANYEGAEDYHIFESKMGLIFLDFKYYIKHNLDYLIESRNTTFTLVSHGDEDDDEIKTSSDVSVETLGVEVDYTERFFSFINISRDIYDLIFDGEDKLLAKNKLSRIYNNFLLLDITNRELGQNDLVLIDTEGRLLNEEDYDSMKDLLDINEEAQEKMTDLKTNHLLGSDLTSIMSSNGRLPESEIIKKLTLFFALLVKSRISLSPRDSVYFNNLNVFKVALCDSVEKFMDVMASTKISLNESPEFPLLRDKKLSEMVLSIDIVPNKDKFLSSISSSVSDKAIDTQEKEITEIPNSLRVYLNRIIEEYERAHNPIQDGSNVYIPEIVKGVNKDTITEDNYRKAVALLNEEQAVANTKTFVNRYEDFKACFDLLKGGKYYVNTGMHEGKVKEYLLDFIKSKHTDLPDPNVTNKTIPLYNAQRLNNLWKLIKVGLDEIYLYLDGDDLSNNNYLDGDGVLYGVEYLQVGEFKIPKVQFQRAFIQGRNENVTGYVINYFGRDDLVLNVQLSNKLTDGDLFITYGRIININDLVTKDDYIDSIVDTMTPVSRQVETADLLGITPNNAVSPITDWMVDDNYGKSTLKVGEKPSIAEKKLQVIGDISYNRKLKDKSEDVLSDEDVKASLDALSGLDGMF